MKDQDFKNGNYKLKKNHSIYTKGTIIGNDGYKPDISIIDNTTKTVVCCLESSSTGDRKVGIGELLQAEKYAIDNNIFMDLVICLCGKSSSSPTVETQYNYMKPYYLFLKSRRGKSEGGGVRKIYLIDDSKFTPYADGEKELLGSDFERECKILR